MSKNTYLTWLEDDSLFKAIKHVHDKYKTALQAQRLSDFTSNVIDPFVFVFDVNLTDKDPEDWVIGESARQLQKSLNNAIGEFHQIVLGSCNGWVDLGVGDDSYLDLMKKDRSIYAEIKNKYNTMNSSATESVFQKLKAVTELDNYPEAYLVQIVRKSPKPYNQVWNYRGSTNQRIKKISGDIFYQLVTNQANALQQLYEILPIAIKDFFAQADESYIKVTESGLWEEIERNIGKPSLKSSDLLPYFFNLAYRNTASNNPLQLSLNFDNPVEDDEKDIDNFEGSDN